MDNNARIGSKQIVFGQKSYATEEVRSVETWSIRADRNSRVALGLMLVSAPVFLAWFIVMESSADRLPTTFLGVAYGWIMLCALMLLFFTTRKPEFDFRVRLYGKFGKANVFSSRDEGYTQKIAGAISAAITGGTQWQSREAARVWWMMWRP